MLITGAADGQVHALEWNTGKPIWSFPVGSNVINTSPVMEGTLVFASHGEENIDVGQQGRIVCLDAGQIENGRPKKVWDEIGIKAGLASSLVHDGRWYVPDDGATLHCYDAKTGKRHWRYKYGRLSRGTPVFADGKIYVADVNAKFHILQPSERGCKELHTQSFYGADTEGGFVETNGTPAVANGRIYFGTRDELYCVGKHDWKGPAPLAKESPKKNDDHHRQAYRPTQLLIEPADVTLVTGNEFEFNVHVADPDGDILNYCPVMWPGRCHYRRRHRPACNPRPCAEQLR